MLVEHRLLEHLRSSQRRPGAQGPQSPTVSPPKEVIEEKAENEECEAPGVLTMLLGKTLPAEAISCRSQQSLRPEAPEPSFYSSNPYTHRDSSGPSHQSSSSAVSKEERELQELEEELRLRDNLPEIICRCALFWRKEKCDGEDYSRFGRLIRDYVEIRIKPKALSRVGEGLLANGFFALAFIKYVSMPETSEDLRAAEEADNIRLSMFELFAKEYVLTTNREEFEDAYRRAAQEEAERLRSKHAGEAEQRSELKRDPMRSSMKSSIQSVSRQSQADTYGNTQEEGTQTDVDNR